jgi:hypothetical protein
MADDTLALLSRAEAYTAINDPSTATAVTSERDDEVIDVWVPAISRRIDELCGPVVARAVAAERHDGGGRLIALRRSPALSVTTVVEYELGTARTLTRELDTTLPDYGYLLETVGTTTFITRRHAGFDRPFYPGRQNIKVDYQAGRYATTAAVDPKFKMCASAILVQMWAKYSGAWARGGDPFAEAGGTSPQFFDEVDRNVRRWLGDELRAPAVA